MLQGIDRGQDPVLPLHGKVEKEQMFYVAQKQIDTNEVEILWECVTETQAQDEVDRINSHLADYGIPGEFYAYVY